MTNCTVTYWILQPVDLIKFTDEMFTNTNSIQLPLTKLFFADLRKVYNSPELDPDQGPVDY